MSKARRIKAAVLLSGKGSNLQAFIDTAGRNALEFDIGLVISDRPQAAGLGRAREAGIEACCVAAQGIADRAAYDQLVAAELERHAPGLIILAGFMRILSAAFVNRYAGRILNIHPSLLPLYPGLNTHARALAAGDREHGCTVHFVTEELDGGPRIMQGRVPVRETDDADTLAARVLEIEHRIYPRAANLFAAGRISYRDGHCFLDGAAMEEPLCYPDPL
ncbi:MAG: phosphoribosylglycinamide formyltransferase [Halioglobus sp.]|nr:phosphoribosylglycinamide formyltransferase [Halioglobus sp.]